MRNAIFLFLTFCAQLVLSQDLIVKSTGDSLNCLITRNENSYMYFNRIENHRLKRDSLALADIKAFKVDYYNTSKPEIKKETAPRVIIPKPVTVQSSTNTYRPSTPSYAEEKDFMISFNAGISIRTVAIPPGLDPNYVDFLNDVKKGGAWGIEGAYFFKEHIGIGINFSQHMSNVTLTNVLVEDSLGNYQVGDYVLKIRINNITPTFYVRSVSDNEKSVFLGKASLGFTTFYQKEEFLGDYLKITGNNIGLSIGGEYMYKLDPSIALGVSIDYHIAQINTLTYDDGYDKFTISYFPEDVKRYDLKFLLAYWF